MKRLVAHPRFFCTVETMGFRRPFRTDFVLDGEPDSLCLANFRLSRWDERRCQMQFGLKVWGSPALDKYNSSNEYLFDATPNLVIGFQPVAALVGLNTRQNIADRLDCFTKMELAFPKTMLRHINGSTLQLLKVETMKMKRDSFRVAQICVTQWSG